MQTLIRFVTALLVAGVAGQASAKTLPWHGTLKQDFSILGETIIIGSGVSTVNDFSGNHLETLRLAGGIDGTDIFIVTDPDTSNTFKSLRITLAMKTGTILGISGGPPLSMSALPIAGLVRVCILFSDCLTYLPVPATKNSGATGLGVGGLITAGGYVGVPRFSFEFAPWTIGTAMAVNQTDGGLLKTLTVTGFVHGPASLASSTAQASGVIRLLSPAQVTTFGVPGNTDKLALFNSLTIHFIPEPGLLLLLGTGVVGLALAGRGRMRR